MTAYRTVGTDIVWHDLATWLAGLVRLGRRRPTAQKYQQVNTHMRALPIAMIYACDDPETLHDARDKVIDNNFGKRPGRGHRADAPHTPIIMAINNRLAQLAARPVAETVSTQREAE